MKFLHFSPKSYIHIWIWGQSFSLVDYWNRIQVKYNMESFPSSHFIYWFMFWRFILYSKSKFTTHESFFFYLINISFSLNLLIDKLCFLLFAVIGTAFALNMLFSIPIWCGVLLTGLSTLILLALQQYGVSWYVFNSPCFQLYINIFFGVSNLEDE